MEREHTQEDKDMTHRLFIIPIMLVTCMAKFGLSDNVVLTNGKRYENVKLLKIEENRAFFHSKGKEADVSLDSVSKILITNKEAPPTEKPDVSNTSFFLEEDAGQVEEWETLPAKILFKMSCEHPDATVLSVTGNQPRPNADFYYKAFYDRERKLLVRMERMTMQMDPDELSWRVWHNVEPKQFEKMFPYMLNDVKSTADYNKKGWDKKLGLLSVYKLRKDHPEITKWP